MEREIPPSDGTRRPLLLGGVGRLSESGHQLKLQLTGMHAATLIYGSRITRYNLFSFRTSRSTTTNSPPVPWIANPTSNHCPGAKVDVP